MRYFEACMRFMSDVGSRYSYHQLLLLLVCVTALICTILSMSGRKAQ